MKILMINSVCGIRSTGRICTDLAAEMESQGHEVKIAYGREVVPKRFEKYAVRIGNDIGVYLHLLESQLFDAHGLGSKKATREFLKWAEEYNPDLLWLHNIHGYYINYEDLFKWIKSRPKMEVKWTLHDCWAFTGHCSYFTMVSCDKWQSGCESCPQPKKYPARLFIDNSKRNYEKKKACFCGVPNLTIITPSDWLAGLVKKSFLFEYPVEVIKNKIDTSVFKPTESDFKRKYNLIEKKIILGVASVWDERKGLEDFIQLSSMLSKDYHIVLVGLSAKQISKLPSNVLGISSTNSASQLAEIYSAADVFVNLTYEDNYPTTNLEASACGTPVLTYRTGGSPESTEKENVVECGDVEGIWQRIQELLITVTLK